MRRSDQGRAKTHTRLRQVITPNQGFSNVIAEDLSPENQQSKGRVAESARHPQVVTWIGGGAAERPISRAGPERRD